jgi:hypothetical protein
VLALLVFVLTFAVCATALVHRRPAGIHFLPDEWYLRGVNLRLFHTLGVGDEPMTFRPPGYPAFIAAVLAVRPRPPLPDAKEVAQEPEILYAVYGESGQRAVYWAQSVLLAATAALLFLWASRFLSRELALWAALIFGTNPYTVITAGTLHYDVLHLFGLVASAVVLEWALETERRRGLALGLAGACWGLTTLVRPLTLILPPFLILLLRFGRGLRWTAAWKATLLVGVGMLAVIAPWTWRNYRVAGRIIPVNSQTWVALWAATVEKVGRDPNHLRWQSIWMSPESVEVQRTVSRQGFVRYPDAVVPNLAIEDAFRARALQNLATKPGVYLHNVAIALVTLNLDMDSALIRVFEYVQRPDFTRMPNRWFFVGHPQDFQDAAHARAFVVLIGAFTLLAAWGVVAALRTRERGLAVAAAAYLCICCAHALTWVDLRYYYVKLPYLFLFAGYGVQAVGAWKLRLPGVQVPVQWLLAAPLAALSAALTLIVL